MKKRALPREPMIAQLPAFGRLCSSGARAFGLGPLSLAGPRQRLWLRDAQETLGFLEARGGFISGFRFVALDERAWGRVGESLASLGRGAKTAPPPGSLACSSSSRLKGRMGMAHVASARQDRLATPCFDELARAVGGQSAARKFVVLHEWGHAWQTQAKRAFVRQAAIRSASPVALDALEELGRLARAGVLSLPDPSTPHGLACARAEEAFCDALGCWGLGAMGHGRVAALAAGFREASRPIAGPSIHMSHGALLDFFDWKAPMPESFKGFLGLAMSRGADSASGLFGKKANASTPT